MDDLLNSSQVVNSATILSFVLAIIFFIYQEWRQRNQERKEALRLKEEITNLVIRNHVNSGVHIININLDMVIEGFEKSKNCKLRISKEDLLKMIYSRVYENEHITDTVRLELLKQLEEILNNQKYEILTSVVEESADAKMFTIRPLVSITISFLLFVFLLLAAESLKFKINNILMFLIFIILPIIVIFFIKPIIDKNINLLLTGRKTKNPLINEHNYNLTVPNNKTDSGNQGIKFDEFFIDNKEIREVLEQRVLIETILRDIYKIKFNEETRLPVVKLISLLKDEGIISEVLSPVIKEAFTASSFVAHEGRLPKKITDYKQLIDALIEVSSMLYQILKTMKK